MKKVLIIGGGVAGLTAGIFLQKQGFSCEIVEQNAVAGGNLCGWERSGHRIDNCVHWLTGTREGTPLYALWQEIGALSGERDVCRLPSFYASSDGEKQIAFSRDLHETRAAFHAVSPQDHRATDRFFDAARQISRSISSPRAGDSLREAAVALAYGRKDLRTVASEFRSPLLRHALTDLLTGEYSSLGLLFAYGAFAAGNADLPAGGSAVMASRIENRFRSLGGTLHLGIKARKLLLRGGRVQELLTDQGSVTADGFIVATDPAAAFGRLLPAELLPGRRSEGYHGEDAFPIYSAFQAAFSVETAALPFCGICGIPIEPLGTDGRLITRLPLRSFSYEPGFAPEGRTVLQVMVFQHRPACRDWIESRKEDRAAYDAHKQALAEAVASRIKSALPATESSLRLLDCWTPASYRRYLSVCDGAFMSPAITGKRIPFPPSGTLPGISNLQLAGQWYRVPGGLPSAAMSGKAAAERLASRLRGTSKNCRTAPSLS